MAHSAVALYEAYTESRGQIYLTGTDTRENQKHKETEITVRPLYISKHKDEIKEPRVTKVKRFFRVAPLLMHSCIYGSVLRYFKSVNRKAGSNLAFWRMRNETFCHVNFLIRTFKWVVLPASLIFVCVNFVFFGQNVLDSMFFGIVIFVYSSFLPDLLSMYRLRKIGWGIGVTAEDLPWYKKYILLLFAPLFIGIFFLGIRLRWKSTETFHNFKSLAIYVAFLFTLSCFVFGDFPLSIGGLTQIFSLPVYGFVGYLTHLKVDR